MSLLQGTNIAQSEDVTGIRRRYSYEPYQEYIKYLKDIAINLRDKSPQPDLLSQTASAKQELKAFSMWADGLRRVLTLFNEEAAKHDRQEDIARDKPWFVQNIGDLYESVKIHSTRAKMLLNEDQRVTSTSRSGEDGDSPFQTTTSGHPPTTAAPITKKRTLADSTARDNESPAKKHATSEGSTDGAARTEGSPALKDYPALKDESSRTDRPKPQRRSNIDVIITRKTTAAGRGSTGKPKSLQFPRPLLQQMETIAEREGNTESRIDTGGNNDTRGSTDIGGNTNIGGDTVTTGKAITGGNSVSTGKTATDGNAVSKSNEGQGVTSISDDDASSSSSSSVIGEQEVAQQVYPNNNIHAELIRQMRRLGETFRDGQVNRQHQLASITNELVTLSHRHQERDQHFSMIHQQLNRMVHANHLMATEYQELQHCLEKTVLKVGLQQL